MSNVFGGLNLYQTPVGLFRLIGANLNSTADQQFTRLFGFNNYVIREILATNAAGAVSLAAGGIYTATAKGGTAVVAAAQSWTGLTSTTATIFPTLGALAASIRNTDLYLSLTTGQGSANTCDILITGIAWS